MNGWQITETRDGDVGRLKIGEVEAFVQDRDGDGSYWWVKRASEEVAKGQLYAGNDFEMALAAAWAAVGTALPRTYQHD
mgnify:CR=1 FL=1|tara:strand:+ start:888 stop:1124 length:237 start_codon:yes stop_codon:yes gene_type:complete